MKRPLILLLEIAAALAFLAMLGAWFIILGA